MIFSKKFQKGISLPLSIIILAIILAIALGLTSILVSQIRIIRGMGYSVTAFFAADTGIERVLKVIIKDLASPYDNYSENDIGNGSGYNTRVLCCLKTAQNTNCEFQSENDCPVIDTDSNSDVNPNCQATKYCVRSVGTFHEVKRAIEVKVYPAGQ